MKQMRTIIDKTEQNKKGREKKGVFFWIVYHEGREGKLCVCVFVCALEWIYHACKFVCD